MRDDGFRKAFKYGFAAAFGVLAALFVAWTMFLVLGMILVGARGKESTGDPARESESLASEKVDERGLPKEDGIEPVGCFRHDGVVGLTYFVGTRALDRKPIRALCERLKDAFASGPAPSVVRARYYDERAAVQDVESVAKFPEGPAPHLVAEFFYDPRDYASYRVFHGALNPDETAPVKAASAKSERAKPSTEAMNVSTPVPKKAETPPADPTEKTPAEKDLEARILGRNADAPAGDHEAPVPDDWLKGVPHPPSKDEAARKKFGGVLKNARTLAEAKLYDAARKDFERIIAGAPGAAIAKEARHELDQLPASP
jgi:hypothetical protein